MHDLDSAFHKSIILINLHVLSQLLLLLLLLVIVINYYYCLLLLLLLAINFLALIFWIPLSWTA